MNKRLQKAIDRAHTKYWAQTFFDGDFTLILLFDNEERTHLISFGIAKRNTVADEYNEVRGVEIAYARAVKKLMKPVRKRVKK